MINPNVFIEETLLLWHDGPKCNESTDAYNLVLLLNTLDGAYTGVANGMMEDDIAAGLAQIPYGTVMTEEYTGNDVIMTMLTLVM